MNRDSAIGVFDSGIGGLTVLQRPGPLHQSRPALLRREGGVRGPDRALRLPHSKDLPFLFRIVFAPFVLYKDKHLTF